MNERDTSSQLSKLDERLRSAREARDVVEKSRDKKPGGVGFAFRIGVELVAALIVGVGIGLLLDGWLGTAPWFLIGFFFIGSGAGIVNVYRATSNFGLAVGYREVDAKDAETPGQESTTINMTETKKSGNDTAKQ